MAAVVILIDSTKLAVASAGFWILADSARISSIQLCAVSAHSSCSSHLYMLWLY